MNFQTFCFNLLQLTIEVKSINSDYDNFIAIDDISYEAIFCSEAVDAWDLGGNFYPTPMLSALMQRPIFSTKVKKNLILKLVLYKCD